FLHSEYSPDLGVFYSNPRMDELLEEAMVKKTIEERTPIYEEIQRLMAEEAPVVPLFQGKLVVVTRIGIEGVVLDPTMIFRYYLVYSVE
ncbi:peptide ABC transporter substrate-binding protein, partial [Candidatus Bathyarchaeota archaeon]